MNDDRRELDWWELDKELVGWGIAHEGRVSALGFGFDAYEQADSLWNPDDPTTGVPVYYHPDMEWVNGATGKPIEREQDERER